MRMAEVNVSLPSEILTDRLKMILVEVQNRCLESRFNGHIIPAALSSKGSLPGVCRRTASGLEYSDEGGD